MTDLFHEIPGNPVPEKATGGFLTARDGKKLRYCLLRRDGRPLKGTVIILPGRNECIEKYFETIRDLSAPAASRGDRSTGAARAAPTGCCATRSAAMSTASTTMSATSTSSSRRSCCPTAAGPIYVLAHSTGSLVALLAAPSLVNRVRRMVLVAPFLTLAGFPLSMKAIRRIASVLYCLGLGSMYWRVGRRAREATPFATNMLTTDITPLPAQHRCSTRPTRNWRSAARRSPGCAPPASAAEIVQDPEFIARIQIPDAVRRRRRRRGRLDAGDRATMRGGSRRRRC